MGERHRTGPRDAGAPADERLHRRRVMRCAVRSHVDQGLARGQQTRYRVHRSDFQRLLPAEPGQDGRQPLREHRLAGARRPLQEQVVPACGGDLHGRTRRDLAHHIGEVVTVVGLGGAHAVHARGRSCPRHAQTREQRIRAALLVRFLIGHGFVREDGDQLAQAAHSQYGHTRHQRRLGRRALRDDHLLVAGVGGGQHGGQDAPDGTHSSVQAQLADHHDVGENPWVDPLGGTEDGACHGQVEAAAGLGHGCRAEPDGELLLRPGTARVRNRRPNPVPALRQTLVRQSHQGERRHPRLQVRLNLDHNPFDAHQGHRARTRERHVRPPPARARPRARHGGAGRCRPGRYGRLRVEPLRERGSSVPRGLVAAVPSRA